MHVRCSHDEYAGFCPPLAILDLVALLVTVWAGILPVMLGWVLIVLVAIPLVEMMHGSIRSIVRDFLGVDRR